MRAGQREKESETQAGRPSRCHRGLPQMSPNKNTQQTCSSGAHKTATLSHEAFSRFASSTFFSLSASVVVVVVLRFFFFFLLLFSLSTYLPLILIPRILLDLPLSPLPGTDSITCFLLASSSPCLPPSYFTPTTPTTATAASSSLSKSFPFGFQPSTRIGETGLNSTAASVVGP